MRNIHRKIFPNNQNLISNVNSIAFGKIRNITNNITNKIQITKSLTYIFVICKLELLHSNAFLISAPFRRMQEISTFTKQALATLVLAKMFSIGLIKQCL